MDNSAEFQTYVNKLRSKKLTQFSRLIPEEGIKIYPSIQYIDSNDVSEEERRTTKEFFSNDSQYLVTMNFASCVPKGKKVGRQYCVYAHRLDNGDAIGNVKFNEVLDNPHGFGENDFHYVKWIFPQYRYTKYSRYIIGDLIYLLFMAGVANRLYVYVPLKKDIDNSKFWMGNVDKLLAPCLSRQYDSDSNEVQKYIKVNQIVPGFKVDYMLLEFNGDIYRNMDHRAYLSAVPGRSKETVDRWLEEMNEAALLINNQRLIEYGM